LKLCRLYSSPVPPKVSFWFLKHLIYELIYSSVFTHLFPIHPATHLSKRKRWPDAQKFALNFVHRAIFPSGLDVWQDIRPHAGLISRYPGLHRLEMRQVQVLRIGAPIHRIHLIRSCSWLERMGKCWEDWEAVATTRNHQLCHIIHDSIQFCCCRHPLASPSQPQEKIKQISASVQIQIHPTRPQWHSSKLRKQREKKTEWCQEMVDYYGLLRWSSDPAAPPCPSQPLQALSPLLAACAAFCSAAPIAPRHRGARALPVLGRWQSFPYSFNRSSQKKHGLRLANG
jgi:hypothetical protein